MPSTSCSEKNLSEKGATGDVLTTSTIETAVLKHSRDSDKALIPAGKSYLSGIGHRFSSYFISQML